MSDNTLNPMESKRSKKQQPTPPKGFEFTGWATFNWGLSHNRVYRTRKEAIKALIGDEYTWQEMKGYMKVIKVKCVVV